MARKHGKPVIIMEPVKGGALAALSDDVAAPLRAARPEKSIASWAMRWVASLDNCRIILSGMSDEMQLADNLATFSPLEPLSQQEQQVVASVREQIRARTFVGCTACRYCMPCPFGVDIPGNFRHYNKCVQEGFVDIKPESDKGEGYNSDMREFRRNRRKYLISYQRDVMREARANKCINCGQCIQHCPQSIDIPHELRKIDLLVENLRRSIED